MIKQFAHIVGNKVVNMSIWDGQSEWSPKEDVVEVPTVDKVNPETKEILTVALAGIGWSYINGEFIDDRPQLATYDPQEEI